MIRIDLGGLYEMEQEEEEFRRQNRRKLTSFIALCEQVGALVVEQRDWNQRDYVHFVGISPNVVITIGMSEKYLAVQSSQLREKFAPCAVDYVSLPDRQTVTVEKSPSEKLDVHEVITCSKCGEKTPYDGFFQFCVRCGEKLDTLVKVCQACHNNTAYHPAFRFCPVCGGELTPNLYDGPPLTEFDPNGLIWGVPLKDEFMDEPGEEGESEKQ
ncbi:MAG: zinc ribbon domain-containing protein [Candidatus Latescibacteria bacterium]|nr:zinc ribbon domain-containing protein [Candidatus Latescibacterota bacterium]